MKLSHGKKTLLRFRLPEGMQWPEDILPETYFQDCAEEIRVMRDPDNRKNIAKLGNKTALDFNMLNVHSEAPGEFSFQLACRCGSVLCGRRHSWISAIVRRWTILS